MTGRPAEWRSVAAFAALVVAWSLNYVFVRVGLTDSPPLWLAFLRAAIGAVGVFIALAAGPGSDGLGASDRRDALLIGVPTFGLFFGLWFVAAGSVLPGETAVVIYTFPLWVTILSALFLRQGIAPLHAVSIVIGFAGVVLVTRPSILGGPGVPLPVVVELLLGAISWATGTILAQRRFRPDQIAGTNAFQLLGGALTLLVAAVVFEPSHGPRPSVELVIIVAWLGLVGTAFAYAVWFSLLARVSAVTLSGYVFLVPVGALVASALLIGERLLPVQIAGAGLVVAGVVGIGRASAIATKGAGGRSSLGVPDRGRTPPEA